MSASDNRPAAGPVWAKRAGAVSSANISYCAGRDVVSRPACDAALQDCDLCTNAAHVIMLAEQGALSGEDERAILSALGNLRGRVHGGESLLVAEAEDVHMSVELAVREIAGDAAGRMHSGRSRNDQVATDMALWLRDRIARRVEELSQLAAAIAAQAQAEAETPMPGLTHQQPAMVTTLGHWLAGYLPRLGRLAAQWRALLVELDECPLGAAAGFGTSWPIRRERTAELLGFRRPSASSIDTVWRRGESETRHAFLLGQLLASLSGIGEDLMLLSSPPRSWLRLDDECVTGSSIMPQKRNPDFAEVTRAKAASVQGIVQGLLATGSRAVSGYNRQSQWTKYLLMDADAETDGACSIFEAALGSMQIDRDAMRAACDEGFLNAADSADLIARSRSVPFRVTYRILGGVVRESEALGRIDFDKLDEALREEGLSPLENEEREALASPEGLIRLRRHTGGPHPDSVRESIDASMKAIDAECTAVLERAGEWTAAVESLWELAEKRASMS